MRSELMRCWIYIVRTGGLPPRRLGIGREMMQMMLRRYSGFHQLMLTADGRAIDFYRSLGLERAGKTEPMWIYKGGEH
jgi:ribosomal protein S18 acetylase RimI-like enzyme